MQKKFKWVFFAFTLILATMIPSSGYASTFSYDDLPEYVKALHSRTDKFAYGSYMGIPFVTSNNITTDAGGTNRISVKQYNKETQTWASSSSKHLWTSVKITFSTYDISKSDGTVFFSKTMEPIPKALSQVLPNLMSQSKKILPVGLVVLSALLVVSLIPKVLYRLF